MTVVQHAASIRGDQANDGVESSSLASAVRSKQSNNFALLDPQADTVYNATASVSFANFISGQGTHLSCHSRLCYHRRTCFAFYEHPIIASKESQRNAGSSTPFGIKNAGRSAGQDELVVGCRVDQGLPVGPAGGLLDYYVALADQMIQLS